MITHQLYAATLVLACMALVSCKTESQRSAQLNWNDWNYAELTCKKGAGKCSKFNEDEDGINAIGKGKK